MGRILTLSRGDPRLFHRWDDAAGSAGPDWLAKVVENRSLRSMMRTSPSATGSARWEHFPHDADVGVRGFGASAEEAFEQAAQALTAVVTHAAVEPKVPVEVGCEAADLELLFVEWLNCIIYEMAVRQMLFGRFAVKIEDGRRLTATLWGEAVDVARHAPACEPKGATYTALKVGVDSSGTWSAGCVIDV
jgi:SHS2 domain-containing protein